VSTSGICAPASGIKCGIGGNLKVITTKTHILITSGQARTKAQKLVAVTVHLLPLPLLLLLPLISSCTYSHLSPTLLLSLTFQRSRKRDKHCESAASCKQKFKRGQQLEGYVAENVLAWP